MARTSYYKSTTFRSTYFGPQQNTYTDVSVGFGGLAAAEQNLALSQFSTTLNTYFSSSEDVPLRLTIDTQVVTIGLGTSVVKTDGTTVTQGCMYPESLSISYEGKALSLVENFVSSDAQPTYSLESVVDLELDFGDGLVKYFHGKIKSFSREAGESEDRITYSAVSDMTLSNEIEATGDYGNGFLIGEINIPNTLTVGSSLVAVQSGAHPTMRQAVQALFNSAGPVLLANSISSTVDVAGIPADLYVDATTQISGGFLNAIKTLLSAAPGIRPWYDETTETWMFYDVFQSPKVTISINTACVDSFEYTSSSEDRYTAIKLRAEDGIAGMSLNRVTNVQNGWEKAKEDVWALQKTAANEEEEFKAVDETLEDVYRVFRLPMPPGAANQAVNVRIHYRINDKPGDQFAWHSVEAELEMRSGLDDDGKDGILSQSGPLVNPAGPIPGQVGGYSIPNPYVVATAKVPIVVSGNPYAPGDAVGPKYGIAVTYFTPTPIALSQNVRYPEVGYTGTAFTEFGLQREKIEVVPIGQATLANAYRKLLPLMNTKKSGSVSVFGNPIQELMNLNARLSLVHDSRVTGLEDGQVIVADYTYNFEDASSSISFDNDFSRFIQDGG